ncbi:dynein intermediate chain 2, axonemal isoform X2 [Chiroxiphia lanceolata]|uniref:dynein intermediate chain 2, axonemal isoform X2 n=1 Tax=Chiroxiphia lanceolata TaxID=296741 RepID=UPI0013CE8BC8|nr:dynein intermediate chain 2, axonemal isoform X2 [Chiroxiphia lanceolata]
MEIKFEYTRKRSDFGRPCNFSDLPAEVTVDIPPDPSLAEDFIPQDPVDFALQHAPVMALHEVNTERVQATSRGVNHVEGGWPKHVDPKNTELTSRYREEVERDEIYTRVIQHLGTLMEHCIRQNNAIDIYEEYFADDEEEEGFEDPPSAKTISAFSASKVNFSIRGCWVVLGGRSSKRIGFSERDPNVVRRTATHLSWHPDSGKELAVAYCSLEFQDKRRDISFDSYIWDMAPYKPVLTLMLSSPVVTLEYNPKDWHHLLGGCYNGQIVYWDTRKGGLPMEATPVELSHRDPVYGALWLPSRTGTECFSASTDGQVLWWDIRKLSQPSERLVLDITREDQLKNALGAISLDFSLSMPTKFLVGTEQGSIINCNRDAKTPPEKIANVFNGHIGAVYAVARSPFNPKVFLSVGDWTARIWSEENLDSSSIMETKCHVPYLLDGCWSPVKPAVFFTVRSDGTLDVWDFLFHQKEPSLSLKVSNDPLLSLRPQDNGRIVGCGTKQGTINILEISSGLCTLRKNEKSLTSTMFEREARREKVLQDKQRELQVRAQLLAKAKKEEPEDPQKVFKQARKEFFNVIKAEQQRRGETVSLFSESQEEEEAA